MSTNLDADYSNFKKEVEKPVKLFFKIERDVETAFKKHHSSIYALALIHTKLKSKYAEENKIIFLAEILSDLLSLTKLAMAGFELPALIVLRRVTENFYNHAYYFDHPIEYRHLNAGKNEYTPIDKLKTYFDAHPVFFDRADPNVKNYNQDLFNEYHQLCKIVHAKGKDSMNLAKNLKELFKDFEIKEFLKQVCSVELYLIYLTFKFHKELKFTARELALLTSIIPVNKRNTFTQ